LPDLRALLDTRDIDQMLAHVHDAEHGPTGYLRSGFFSAK
jgi:hypothetical protein